ncbi:Putative ribonuclease H protein At1g65750, partial [Linum grandiflorum]
GGGGGGGGGVLRNSLGIPQGAFTADYGGCTITRSELRAATHNLHLAWNLGFKRVNLQVDSAVVISLITSTSETDLQHKAGVEKLQGVIDRDWRVHVSHTYGEENRVADILTHHGHSLPFRVHSICAFSSTIINYIKVDMIGVSFPKSIAS